MHYYPVFSTFLLSESACLDLSAIAAAWYAARPIEAAAHALLDPKTFQTVLDAEQRARGARWSFGSYLEDRSTLLRGTYLDELGGYLHLGIDCNVPAGTPIAAPYDAQIIDIFDDRDEPGGWGKRVIIQAAGAGPDEKVVFGHLGDHDLRVGDHVAAGQIFLQVGAPPFNGCWWPHLHVQCIAAKKYEELAGAGLSGLDGYGHPREVQQLRTDYPDPTWLVMGSR